MNPDRAMRYVELITAAGLVLPAVKWAFLSGRRLPRHRVRQLRIRLRLRLHPGKGHATVFELWWRWGRPAAFRGSRRTRPQLTLAQRILTRARAYSILAGRAQYRHALRLPSDEHAVIFSPPRGGKTGWLARIILRYPGPVISTTTKADVHALTSGVRAGHGPVHVFNPQHTGGAASTFTWNPLDGCEEPAAAIRRADAFAAAVSQKGVEDASFWAAKASDYLRGYFHAAALAGLDLRTVARWVAGTALDEPEHILRTTPGASAYLADQLAEMRGEANKTISTVRMTMSRGLAFLADPALAASVLPAPGDGLNTETFLSHNGTLYLIAETQGEDAPVAPLFACLASEIHYTAALHGSNQPGARLDPPLLMARSPRSARSRSRTGSPTPAARASRSSPSRTAKPSSAAAGAPTAPGSSWTPPAPRSGSPASRTPTPSTPRPGSAAPPPCAKPGPASAPATPTPTTTPGTRS